MLEKIFSIKEEFKGEKCYRVFRFFGIKFKKRIRKGHIYLVDGDKRKEVKKVKGLDIDFIGHDAIVEIGCNPLPKFINSRILIGSNSFVKIGSTDFPLKDLYIRLNSSNSKVTIGDNLAIAGSCFITSNEPNINISIGEDCLFSSKIYIRASDGHTIYNMETKEVLNYPKDITIGNHVWLGNSVKVLKGANIPDNFIVGIDSLVSKDYVSSEMQTGGVLAGIPAKVLRTGCTWSSKSISQFLAEQQLGESND